MRCLSCNKSMSDFESTRKFKGTQRFVDLCNHCFSETSLSYGETDERIDLKDVQDEVEVETDDV